MENAGTVSRNHEAVDRASKHFPGPMTPAEQEFLFAVKNFIDVAPRKNWIFPEIIKTLMDDMRSIVRAKLKIEEVFQNGGKLRVQELLNNPKSFRRSKDGSPLKPNEEEFLQDIKKMIDFALRNGLGFHFPLEIMSHDIGEIINYHYFDLDEALASGFSPKASGWAKLDEDSFGDIESNVED